MTAPLENLSAAGEGVGASLPRKEDDRFLRGRGEFVADIKLPGMFEIAFLRSPLAHAYIRGIEKPQGGGDRVFSNADLTGVAPIRAVAGFPGFKPSEQPVLATGKIASCRRDNRDLRRRNPGGSRRPRG